MMRYNLPLLVAAGERFFSLKSVGCRRLPFLMLRKTTIRKWLVCDVSPRVAPWLCVDDMYVPTGKRVDMDVAVSCVAPSQPSRKECLFNSSALHQEKDYRVSGRDALYIQYIAGGSGTQ